jgi:ABC-2 type transport system ATP-binding protein
MLVVAAEPSDLVLSVTGLTKRFKGGVLAVDHLDFGVEGGTVCGLLGPNGAGKTTTLRMMLGLVHPTSGESHVFGERVRSGTPVLRRVGSLVEGAAFVPSISGIRNLRLWWEAGGDRWDDADVDGALAIAGLGDAINRKVRTYSHGMRQRLGIARSLLARPEALVLDEPTTGLDPQEIRQVRHLVRRAAEQGATVLLSSHLLSEVEQTCTHAVIMDRGRLVTAGRVADLVAERAGTAYFEVDKVGEARRILESLPGVSGVTDAAPGLTVELDGTERAVLVAALVGAGIGVETVTSRHQLEDAFLGILGEEHER